MIAPFNRRDSGCATIVAGLVAGGGSLIAAPGAFLLAFALAGLTMLVLGLLLRTLPPDLRLRPVIEAAGRQAVAPPPPGLARLRVALLPGMLSWVRFDLHLDGARIAQLRPGTATVLPMPPGAHVLTIQVWLRRLGPGEMINALPGTDTDIVIRGSGGTSRQYSVERRGLASVLADRRIVLVETPGHAVTVTGS